MKRVYQLCFVMLYLMFIVSCNDETQSDFTSNPGGGDVTSETIILSQGDNGRVSDYRPTSPGSKASGDAVSQPQLPDNAVSMEGYNPDEELEVVPRVLNQGETMTTKIALKEGCDYYIYGVLNIIEFTNSGGTIYIMEGGRVTLESTQFKRGTTIENFGKLSLPDGVVISDGASLKSYTALTSSGDITVDGVMYCYSAASFGSMTLSSRSAYAHMECKLQLTGKLTLNNGSVHIGKYLKCDRMDIYNYSTLTFGGSSLIEADAIEIETSRGLISNIGDSYSVISCNDLVIKDSDQEQFRGWIDIHADNIIKYNNEEITWLSSVIFDGSTYIPATECNPAFGTSTEQQSYGLQHIAQIAPHETGISATSIDVKDNYAYVSWHTAELEYDGYIDVVDIDALNIASTLYAADRDFNHIYVGEGEIYTAGDNKKGAFIAEIDYPNSLGEVEVYHRKIYGASGNSLLKSSSDSNIWAITGSNGGISIIDPDDNLALYYPLDNAKYIINDGDKMLVLAGYPDAQIYSFDLAGKLLDSYSVGGFFPDDGKNTIAQYGDTTYVALGNNGLKAFENGVNTMSYGESVGSANCVAVDEDYIYLANGVNGFVVLNRSDFTVVAHHIFGDSSANYVALGSDGRIYVAYGQHGINIYELVEM